MDAVLFQEKMDPAHRGMLCQMLKEKNLPEALLERYALLKGMVDRIDAHLSPGDLAMLIYVAGINVEIPEIKNLGNKTFAETTEGEDARLQAQADEMAVVSPGLGVLDDKVIEEKLGGGNIVPGKLNKEQTEQFRGATGQAVTTTDPKAMLWFPGMPVRVLVGDEIKQGKIVGVSTPSAVGKEVGAAVQLTVEFDDGETETFEENEVEAQ